MQRESNFWEKLNAISSALLVIVGFGAVVFAYYQIKEARSDAKAQIEEARSEAKMEHLVEVVREFDEPHYSDIRKRLAAARMDTKRGTVRPLDVDDPPGEMIDLLDFYQHIGFLVSSGYLDPQAVYSEFSDPMFLLYTDGRPLIDARQKQEQAVWGDFVDLVQVMQQIDKDSNAGAGNHPSQEDIFEQYNADAQSPTGGTLPLKRRGPPIKK